VHPAGSKYLTDTFRARSHFFRPKTRSAIRKGEATAAEALAQGVDVFFEYSKPDIAIVNVLAAVQAGAHVVVGTSGLSDEEYARIDAAARAAGRGVLACGNFAITAVLLQKFAEMAVKWLPDVELIDYAKAGKADVPSGTVRELSVRLGAARGEARSSARPLAPLATSAARRISMERTVGLPERP
jgi:dihydrodipicolinate reductase